VRWRTDYPGRVGDHRPAVYLVAM
jgi:hypothetical protein